ncbi:rhoptry neck protein RON6, partial [Toxoplasma gondii COUG]
ETHETGSEPQPGEGTARDQEHVDNASADRQNAEAEGNEAKSVTGPDGGAQANGGESAVTQHKQASAGDSEGRQDYRNGAGYASPVARHDHAEASLARSATTLEGRAQNTGTPAPAQREETKPRPAAVED